MRPFAVYPDSFDGDTLGWWRFGERGGRLDGVIQQSNMRVQCL